MASRVSKRAAPPSSSANSASTPQARVPNPALFAERQRVDISRYVSCQRERQWRPPPASAPAPERAARRTRSPYRSRMASRRPSLACASSARSPRWRSRARTALWHRSDRSQTPLPLALWPAGGQVRVTRTSWLLPRRYFRRGCRRRRAPARLHPPRRRSPRRRARKHFVDLPLGARGAALQRRRRPPPVHAVLLAARSAACPCPLRRRAASAAACGERDALARITRGEEARRRESHPPAPALPRWSPAHSSVCSACSP